MKKTLLCAVLAVVALGSAQAQNRDGSVSLDRQFVIYKWFENGRAHYGKIPPRGVTNYIMLNEYGMEITKERPFANEQGSNIIRPIRPEAEENANANAEGANAALPQGAISRETRCDWARQNLNTLKNKSTVYEDDGNGNLVPLSAETMAQRKQQAEAQVTEFCN